MKSLQPVLIPRQLTLLLILSTGLLNHVMIIPSILQSSGRDGWISVIISYPLFLLVTLLIYYILKNSPPEGFFHLLRTKWNIVWVWIYSLPICLFLFASAYITFVDLIIWLRAYFLADVPKLLIVLIVLCTCVLITWSGIKYMAIASGFLLPLVMIFGFFIAFTNTHLKDPSLLFPILSNGFSPVYKGIIYVLSGLLEIFIVILLQPFSAGKIKLHHLIFLGLILAGLIMGPLTASIMEFGDVESSNMRYPAYEQWRILGIGEFITHLDFFALYQWLCGALIRIGLFMFLLGFLLTNSKDNYRMKLWVVASVYIGFKLLLLIDIDPYFFYSALYKYFFPFTVVFFLIQIFLSALIVKIYSIRAKN
ncbi:endospore germination permease [[Bacillus] enclensis]|uniref:endospore germination permease n=1 Tax=[Bacillus] enclensis TaxID=1402860 RepID=UPI0018DD366E|nr:endospore germination permease [[Bacillus] enclensis]MBH9965321.1 endospore germination permease [[Bacillus] enclensis]